MENVENLYLDVETDGLDSYLGNRICGLSVLRDQESTPFYVPLRHTTGGNLPIDRVRPWLRDCMRRPRRFINHNVKFDAAFLSADGASPLVDNEPTVEMVDTLCLAKMVQTDRYTVDVYGDVTVHGFSLKPICKDWLGIPYDDEQAVQDFLSQYRTTAEKTYDKVPVEILGPYAGGDVIRARALYEHCLQRLPREMQDTVDTEIELTPVLFDMQEIGVEVDSQAIALHDYGHSLENLKLLKDMHRITGGAFTDSSKHMHRLINGWAGLPVLQWNHKKERGKWVRTGPNYDKDAVKQYLHRPEVVSDDKLQEFFKVLQRYRLVSQRQSLYVEGFRKYTDAHGRIHPQFNQIVRTGRMSSRSPNIQQLNKWAKTLILGDFLSCDADQIEFRIIAAYAKIQAVIDALEANPREDFHSLVAEMLAIERSAAKNINFAIAFGAGMRKATQMLSSDPSIRAMVTSTDPGEYESFCQETAVDFIERYHETFPGIQEAARSAQRQCKVRGYVRNWYGRRRHLGDTFAHKAFNAAVQGSASDIAKRLLIKTHKLARLHDCRVALTVHDEILYEGPGVACPNTHRALQTALQAPIPGMPVPITWSMGFSHGPGSTWAIASAQADAGEPGEIVGKEILEKGLARAG